MPEEMPKKKREFLEDEALKAALKNPSCAGLKTVRIKQTFPSGSGPNWEVDKFDPPLPAIAKSDADRAIDVLRGTYSFDPS